MQGVAERRKPKRKWVQGSESLQQKREGVQVERLAMHHKSWVLRGEPRASKVFG